MFLISLILVVGLFFGCESERKQTADEDVRVKTEQMMQEATRQLGMPAIVNFQEKKNLKWIYELCDQENFITHAYFFNSMTGQVGQYLGQCIGYGIPYSTQYTNPERLFHDWKGNGASAVFTQQPEPNGLFKPEGLSATWLIMLDPESGEHSPVYIEPEIIVSPFKLK